MQPSVQMFQVDKEHRDTSEIHKIWCMIAKDRQQVPDTLKPPLVITPSHVIRDPTPLLSYRIFLESDLPVESRNLYKRLMLGVLDALFFLHDHSFNHGSIKPENILIDSQQNAQLTDWGMSDNGLTDDTIALAQCAFEGACHTSASKEYKHTPGNGFWLSFIEKKRETNEMTKKLADLLINADFIFKLSLHELFVSPPCAL